MNPMQSPNTGVGRKLSNIGTTVLSVADMTDAELQDVIRTAKAILLARKQARASKKYLTTNQPGSGQEGT